MEIDEKEEVTKKSFISEWGIPIISAIIIAFLINKFLLFKVIIPSESMVPTLNVDDRLFVTRVYDLDNLKDNYSGEVEVPEGKYFFLGDNRLWSKDSRYWINPYIDGEDIRGKAQIKVYPFSEIGRIK